METNLLKKIGIRLYISRNKRRTFLLTQSTWPQHSDDEHGFQITKATGSNECRFSTDIVMIGGTYRELQYVTNKLTDILNRWNENQR